MKKSEIANGELRIEKGRIIPSQCPIHVHSSPDAGAEEEAATEDMAGEDLIMATGSFVGV